MMLSNNLEEVNVNRWWWLKRWDYNLGLLISGLISFLIGGFTCAILFNPLIPYIFLLFAVVYTVYVIIANILFTSGWVIDIALNKNNDDNFREIIFKCGYWLSVLAPPAVILIYILVILTLTPPQVNQSLPQ